MTLVDVAHLGIDFAMPEGMVPAVADLSFHIDQGEVLALVGESGSGKSVTGLSLAQLLPANARMRGDVVVADMPVGALPEPDVRRLRARHVGFIFQEPMTSLNPVYSIGWQIVEAIQATEPSLSRQHAKERALEVLDRVGIPEPARRFDDYPHQLSGGQRQRVVIALAVVRSPSLIVADEPTTALDVTVQAEILALLRGLCDELDCGLLLITHDMGVVAEMAHNVIVMRDGKAVESGSAHDIFGSPGQEYTRNLLGAIPRLDRQTAGVSRTATPGRAGALPEGGVSSRADPVLRVEDLVVRYRQRRNSQAPPALDGVDLSVAEGEVVGLVGESGSGKSTVARAVLRLQEAERGTVSVFGANITHATKRELKSLRQRMGIVFQDPGSSLNPRYTLQESIAEPIMLADPSIGRKTLRDRVHGLLDDVGLPSSWDSRYPHELSGGQRQRVSIARAIALETRLLIADEATSALDVTVQKRIIDLLLDLQRRIGFSCLFISHDLALVSEIADRVVVLHAGRVVESGPTARVLTAPEASYTAKLIDAVPVPEPRGRIP